MTWGLLLSVAALAVAVAFWHSSLAARELANRVAQETCAGANVQMLDGTVAILRLRLVRGGDAPLPGIAPTSSTIRPTATRASADSSW